MGKSRSTRLCQVREGQKHTRVSNRFVAVESRYRANYEGRTDYVLYMVGVRAKIHGHTHACHSGLAPGVHIQPTLVALNLGITGHRLGLRPSSLNPDTRRHSGVTRGHPGRGPIGPLKADPIYA